MQQPWIIALAKSIETFIIVSMIDMPTIKYWQNLGGIMKEAKQMIPKECRIGDTCFTKLATIEGNLYTRHGKNLNRVHKDSKYILPVIIILGTDVNGGETVFYDGENMHDIGKISHVLKHSHGRCVIGYFDQILHEDLIWTVIELFYHLSSSNQYFFILCIIVQYFMTNIYHQNIGNIISMMT